MLILEMRCALQRHRSTNVNVGRFDCILVKAECVEHIETEIFQLGIRETQGVSAEIITECEPVESEFDVKGAFQRRFKLGKLAITKALIF